MNKGTITILNSRYDDLIRSAAFLNFLQCWGVKDWCDYDAGVEAYEALESESAGGGE